MAGTWGKDAPRGRETASTDVAPSVDLERGPPVARPQLVTLAAAAEIAAVNPKTIRRRIADGTLAGYRIGPRLLRVDLNEVEAKLLRRIPSGGADAAA